jgi:ferredoxin
MRITVDPAACDGFGYCVELLPEVLAFDEWGFPVVVDEHVSEGLLRAARQAVRLCPRRALRLHTTGPDRSRLVPKTIVAE